MKDFLVYLLIILRFYDVVVVKWEVNVSKDDWRYMLHILSTITEDRNFYFLNQKQKQNPTYPNLHHRREKKKKSKITNTASFRLFSSLLLSPLLSLSSFLASLQFPT